MLPVYLILVAMLGTFIIVGVLMLRKAEAIRSELAGIRSEQMKQPKGGPRSRDEALPVYVVNTLNVR